jgi:chromosome segregation ATPase
MFDAIKRVIDSGRVRKPADHLEALIQEARRQTETLTEVLEAVEARGAEVAQVGQLFARVDRKAEESSTRLDTVAGRLHELESRTTSLAAFERRVQALIDAAAQAQHTTEQLLARQGELQSHRDELRRLATLTVETQASASSLQSERAVIDDCRAELTQSRSAVAQAADDAGRLRAEIDDLRSVTRALSDEHAALRTASREVEQGSSMAAAAVQQLEQRLERLGELQRVAASTDEKLAALNSLAEHVMQKTVALDDQKQALHRASADANRLNEMVWTMDAQIRKLGDALEDAARSRDTLGRIEKLAEDTEQKLDIALKLRNEFTLDMTRFEREGRGLLDSVRASLERLALEQTRFDVLDSRLGSIQTSLEGAEARMSLLASKESHLTEVRGEIENVGVVLQALSGRADALAEQQAALDSLTDRLAQVDALARQTSIRYDGLLQSRSEIESLRREIHELRKSQGETAQLRERLASDSAELEALAERVIDVRAQTPALEASIDSLLGRFAQVDGATKKADRLGEVAVELESRLARMAGRLESVASLESRLNLLQRISADVDRRLTEQVGRRGELDALRMTLDGTASRVADLSLGVEALQSLDERLMPLEDRARSLADQVQTIGMGLDEVHRQEAELADRRARLETLLEHNRALAAETTDRNRQLEALTTALERSVAAKNEMMAALSAVEIRQRETLSRSAAAEDHVTRLEGLLSSLEGRRAQLAASEAGLTRVEGRFASLAQKSLELDAIMRRLDERESVVLATRAEVDQIHQAGLKARMDFQYVSEHRESVAATRNEIDTLLAVVAEAEDKIAALQGRQGVIDAVQAKANLVANLLEDLHVMLDSVGEQKAVAEHVAVKLARLEFMMQEAQNTIRALQHERELAQRIERQISQLRGRLGPGSGEGTPAVTA